MTEAEALDRWTKECAEWSDIARELEASGASPSAYDVSQEQRRRRAIAGAPPTCRDDPEMMAALGLEAPPLEPMLVSVP